MKYLPISNFTKRNRFTRQCIGEAMISLMHTKEYEQISVLDIVKKAGISRVTFYKYYHSKTDIINDYLKEIISGYLEEYNDRFTINDFQDYAHIKNAILFFDQYADFLLTLSHSRQYYIVIEALNHYMLTYIYPEYSGSIYELYFYAGALLNFFLKWEESGKKEPVDEIVKIVLSLITRTVE